MKCSICKKDFDKLIAGMCNSCFNSKSMVESKESRDEPTRFVGESKINMSTLMRYSKQISETTQKIIENEKSEENVLKNKIISLMVDLGIKSSDFKIYYNIVKDLYDDYEIEIDEKEYKLVLANNYGVKGGGTVVDKRMGIIVYKQTEYYDEDEIEEPEYEEDTDEEIELVDDSEDDTLDEQ